MILIVDTSIVGVAMALVERGRGVVWNGAHSENAGSILEISELLRKGLEAAGKRSPSDLSGVAVSVGPGSFTGIKIGLAFVQGLQLAAPKLGCLPLSGLEAAAAQISRERKKLNLVLLLPATRTHGFHVVVEGGAVENARLVGFAEAAVTEQAEAARLFGLPRAFEIFTAGPWALAETALGTGKLSTRMAPSAVSAAAIRGMSEASLGADPAAFRTEAPEPRYLRLSTAEEKKGNAT